MFVTTALSLIALLVVSFLSDGIFGKCNNDPIAVRKSPDGRHVASIFIRNCGTTTDYSTVVGLRDTLSDRRYSDVLVLKGKRQVDARWMNKDTISVTLNSAHHVVMKKGNFKNIKIEYR